MKEQRLSILPPRACCHPFSSWTGYGDNSGKEKNQINYASKYIHLGSVRAASDCNIVSFPDFILPSVQLMSVGAFT